MTGSRRSKAKQARLHQADVGFDAEVAKLVTVYRKSIEFRKLIQRNPSPSQVRADLQVYAAEEYAPKVLAALLSQAVSRIADLEDLMSL